MSWHRFAAVLILSATSIGVASAQDAEPQALPILVGDSTKDTDNLQASLLSVATRARIILEKGSPDQVAASRILWESAKNLAQVAAEAHPNDHALFAPLLRAVRDQIKESVVDAAAPDLVKVQVIREWVDATIALQRGPDATSSALGATASVEKGIDIIVRPIRGGKPATGYYIWIDSSCCARKDSSVLPLSGIFTLPKYHIIPATYLFRIVKDGRVVACVIQYVGMQAPIVDVNLEDRRNAAC